ncbi:acetyl-CoA synthetase-like protein [Vararia minispora EC-137]|uniref:Acetyl-CoA synthetase-like protein n=1 Tax=Vararia minispora EC-137 TaxID=1314806 RepID=A0ACB8QFW9_9AGAM|nr:acetyl-CoA synthetase-like protein [Vararia minispora EC-137]
MAASRCFPAPQATNSSTFTPPPLDRSLTFPEYFGHHAIHSPNHPLYVYSDASRVHMITYAAAYRAQLRAAHLVKAAFEHGPRPYLNSDAAPVFGVLAAADAISFVTTMLGIMQTGCTPFPVSTRNSVTAVAHLFRMMDVHQAFVSEDPAMQALSKQATDMLAKENYRLELLPIPRFDDLYDDSSNSFLPTLNDVRILPYSANSVAVIFHSSGTSAFPKPIKVPDRNLRAWGSAMYYGEMDMCGVRFGIQPIPMFRKQSTVLLVSHNAGIEFAVLQPSTPTLLPTSETILEAIVATDCDFLLSVPSFIEDWSQNPRVVETLKRQLKRLIYAGAPLNKQVGDKLTAQGIFVDSFYGMTETGAISHLFQQPGSRLKNDWEYFRFPHPDHYVVELVPQEGTQNLFEVIIMPNDHYRPNVINTSVDGKPAFATGDLVAVHPTAKGWYKIHGRADEQIMLSTGEKTNPVPLERILLQDPLVAAAVFFGRGRFNNGVLIQPASPFDPQDRDKLAEFRNAIWPTVKQMNNFAPAHSRLLKEMIIVTDPSRPIDLTGKSTPRRNVTLATYAVEIEQLYKIVKESSEIGARAPSIWTRETTHTFVEKVVNSVLERNIGKQDDLFQQGCDSLQATWIRNSILRALRTVPGVSTHAIHSSFVYQNPTVLALSNYVFKLITGSGSFNEEISIESRIQAMEALVAKFSADLPIPYGGLPGEGEGETVLITGTTGRLGCHLLVQLVRESSVKHIFALNRVSASAKNPAEAVSVRQVEAFKAWELDPALLSSDKLSLIPCSYGDIKLGLNDELYEAMAKSTTRIIHNAWRVDFNVSLSTFEPLIAGVRNLVDLAARSTRRGGSSILFTSSISVLFSELCPIFEGPIRDPRIAAGLGYGESKWVAETILLRAREEAGLKTTIVRVGQLAGDSQNGAWNEKEWLPAIIRTGQIVQAIPRRDESVTWLPVDVAAAALMDMARTSDIPVLHLVSPKPVAWGTMFDTFSKRLRLPLVPYDEWTRLVAAAEEESRASNSGSPALALAEFFQEGNFGDSIKMSTTQAVKESSVLADVKPLDGADAGRYLEFWQRTGFIRV